ncbi:MAG: hypothetical protein ACFB9M_14855 [Myxococcota bacterium]
MVGRERTSLEPGPTGELESSYRVIPVAGVLVASRALAEKVGGSNIRGDAGSYGRMVSAGRLARRAEPRGFRGFVFLIPARRRRTLG